MQNLSRRLPLIALVASVMLPYGVVTGNNAVFPTYQFWIFPLWMIVHDFGNWYGWGRFYPPAAFPLLFWGLILLAFSLCVRISLQWFYSDRGQARFVWAVIFSVLVLQIYGTIIVAFSVWTSWNYLSFLIIPLPLQPLIVLFLFRSEIRDKTRNQESLDQ